MGVHGRGRDVLQCRAGTCRRHRQQPQSDHERAHSTIYAAGPPQEYAQEFITGSQSVGLGTVIALVGDATGTFNPSAELVTDNSGQPSSTVVTTFTVPAIPTGTALQDETFTPNSSVILSANTSYWFILSASGTDTSAFYRWGYTDSTSYTGSGSLNMIAVSENSGATWTTHPLSYGPEILQVNSVPEPASLILMALASPAIACGFRAAGRPGRLAGRAGDAGDCRSHRLHAPGPGCRWAWCRRARPPPPGSATTKPDRRWSAVRGGPPRHHARSEPAHPSSPRASRNAPLVKPTRPAVAEPSRRTRRQLRTAFPVTGAPCLTYHQSDPTEKIDV